MKKKFLPIAVLLLGSGVYAQVGIGTLIPSNSSQLDISSNSKGVLLPRISLTSSFDNTTITNGNVNSLLVFNTNTQNDVTPGYYYWLESRWMRITNIEDVIAIDRNTVNTNLEVLNDSLILTDSEGNTVSVPLENINIPSTIINNNNGSYTFINEHGEQFTVNVIEDVVTNIQNEGDIYNEIINILQDESDVFVDNGDGTFTHTAVDGTAVTFDANTTTMVNNNDGSYTFTNANGEALTVSVVNDVVTNIQNEGAIYNEIINILQSESDVFVDNGDGTFTHTAVDGTAVTFNANTTLMVNNEDGTYTFTNANGDSLTVNVIEDVVTNIQNEGDIYNEIINILQDETDVFVDNGDGTFTHTAVDGTAVTFDANTTTMVNNNDGSYTFTNANGDELTVNVIEDVVANIQNEGDIYNEIINILQDESDVFVDNGDGTFTHTAVDGTAVTFNANTTLMVNNEDGTYTFTNANGDSLTVNVIEDVVTNIQNEGDIYNEIINILQDETDVFVDNGDGTFTHTAVDGTAVTFDANTTTMVNNNDGSYTFTNANGDELTVNVIEDVVANIQNEGDIYNEIINILQDESDVFVDNGDGTFTHTAVDGTAVTFNANTTLMVNNEDGTYTFTNANGDSLTVNVIEDVVTNIQNEGDIYNEIINILQDETDVFVDNGDGTFTHTAVDGTAVTFDANTTTMVNNNDGSYTFTNANGDELTVNVIEDVVANIQNEGDIYNEIINILQSESDVFVDNGDGTFTHTAVDGTAVTFNANTTSMVNNEDGTYTFTNANGDSLTVNVIEDVVTNIQNEGDIYNEIINILQSESDVFVDNGDGTFTHTAVDGTEVNFNANTTTMVNNNDGSYTFTNANGEALTVSVVNDVVTNIQNEGAIYNEIINILQSESDVFVDNGDGTFTHTAVDGTAVTFNANTTSMVNNEDGTYTFTNANGDSLTVNVIEDVVTNIQNEGDIYNEIINILQSESDVFVDNGDGTFTHTAVDGTEVNFNANTTTMVNNNDGSYTFTNANGEALTVSVIEDVVTNIQNEGDIYNEIINILQDETDVFVDNGDGTFTHTAVDGTAVTFDANTLNMASINGVYTFTDASNNVVGVIDTNANQIIFNDTVTNLGSTNVQGAIENILTRIQTIESTKGSLTGSGILVNGTSTEADAVLKNVTLSIADNSISTSKIIDDSINASKINSDVAGAGLKQNTTTGALEINIEETAELLGKDLTAGDGSIEILNGLGATLVDSNVRVANLGITNDKLAPNSITSDKINDATITGADVATKTITANNLDGGTAPLGSVATVGTDGVVTFSPITTNSITDKKTLRGEGITVTQGNGAGTTSSVANAILEDVTLGIGDNAITSSKILDGSILGTDISSKTISAANLDGGNALPGHVATVNSDGTVSYQTPIVNSQNVTNKGNLSTTDGDNSITVSNGLGTTLIDTQLHVTDGGITTNKLANDAVTNAKLADSSVDSSNIVNGSITNEDISNQTITINKLDATGQIAGNVATVNSDGTVTYSPINPQAIVGKKTISSNGVVKVNGTNAVANASLEDVVITVETANGGNLGVVKEATLNPTVNVGFDGSLAVNLAQIAGNGLVANTGNLAIDVKANNGLGVDNSTDNVQLGGDLVKPTVITTTIANTLSLAGLTAGTTSNYIVTSEESGVLRRLPFADVAIEPWYKVSAPGQKATLNTENIYQMGGVAIGNQTINNVVVNGTTVTPKLFVNGDVHFNGRLFTSNSVYADYVFENYFDGHSDIKSDYVFPKLSDVKSFIKENKHLPGVTPIGDLMKTDNGYVIDYSKLSIEQLEKIEELYIHVINQQDIIDQQKQLIKEQENRLEDYKKRLEVLEKYLSKDLK